jgi:hypothetical protein
LRPCLKERPGQQAGARPYLEDPLALFNLSGGDDLFDYVPVLEEMLAVSFLGPGGQGKVFSVFGHVKWVWKGLFLKSMRLPIAMLRGILKSPDVFAVSAFVLCPLNKTPRGFA